MIYTYNLHFSKAIIRYVDGAVIARKTYRVNYLLTSVYSYRNYTIRIRFLYFSLKLSVLTLKV